MSLSMMRSAAQSDPCRSDGPEAISTLRRLAISIYCLAPEHTAETTREGSATNYRTSSKEKQAKKSKQRKVPETARLGLRPVNPRGRHRFPIWRGGAGNRWSVDAVFRRGPDGELIMAERRAKKTARKTGSGRTSRQTGPRNTKNTRGKTPAQRQAATPQRWAQRVT